MTISVAIVGASGRMGQLAERVIAASDEFHTAARLTSSSEFEEMLNADIVVDVSQPSVSPSIVNYAVDHGKNVLVGTSGWSAERLAVLKKRVSTQDDVGVIVIPNFSLGSVLATQCAATIGRFFDSIEIIESHHAGKVDSPSGTAVRTAEIIEQSRSEQAKVYTPHPDQRARGEIVEGIPIHSVRMNGIIARQDVMFGGVGEVVTITHETTSPSAYEAGIIMGLRATTHARGVIVGLESIMKLS